MKDIYTQRSQLKKMLLIVAGGIVFFSLWYTHTLVREIAKQEVRKVEELAEAYEILNTTIDNDDLENALEIIKKNNEIPVIWAAETGEIYGLKNFDTTATLQKNFLSKTVQKLKRNKQYVEIAFDADVKQYLYYKDSLLLQKLRLYPFYLLGLISFFVLVSFIAFSSSKKAEQNRVWVGMAKETAHQLGTPLSSLEAWIYILKSKYTSEEDTQLIGDMEKDISRLELVAERFSKIGSLPDLQEYNIPEVVEKIVHYISKRASKNVVFSINDRTEGQGMALINPALFEWVLENLLKNALDAIEGKGNISVFIEEKGNETIIDITDSGKGIPKSKYKTVFEPGYSTKKRGWGLGLSLTKRIMEDYHHGKIMVKSSELGKGTTFRIVLFR